MLILFTWKNTRYTWVSNLMKQSQMWSLMFYIVRKHMETLDTRLLMQRNNISAEAQSCLKFFTHKLNCFLLATCWLSISKDHVSATQFVSLESKSSFNYFFCMERVWTRYVSKIFADFIILYFASLYFYLLGLRPISFWKAGLLIQIKSAIKRD